MAEAAPSVPVPPDDLPDKGTYLEGREPYLRPEARFPVAVRRRLRAGVAFGAGLVFGLGADFARAFGFLAFDAGFDRVCLARLARV